MSHVSTEQQNCSFASTLSPCLPLASFLIGALPAFPLWKSIRPSLYPLPWVASLWAVVLEAEATGSSSVMSEARGLYKWGPSALNLMSPLC